MTSTLLRMQGAKAELLAQDLALLVQTIRHLFPTEVNNNNLSQSYAMSVFKWLLLFNKKKLRKNRLAFKQIVLSLGLQHIKRKTQLELVQYASTNHTLYSKTRQYQVLTKKKLNSIYSKADKMPLIFQEDQSQLKN